MKSALLHSERILVCAGSVNRRNRLAEHPQIYVIDISSDGKLLYYSVYSSESDIWLLDLE